MTQFSKILIANRGEIACRIIRSAHNLGYKTVAVYSEADKHARHVRLADEAVPIGPEPVEQSYLNGQAIIEAAKRSGADAVHPGYGFLSENAAFAEACEQAGWVFIGPDPAAIRAMGDKGQAKRLMIEAGVPCARGYQGADQSDAVMEREAERIGYPLMIKAAAGGGGRGMRLVTESSDFLPALKMARSEAQNAFGSGDMILERAILGARHVEIQIFGDAHGDVIHLGERDCSIQRRHQKIIEESPSPAVTPALRERMGAAAVAAARAVRYRGAGTVEFLLDQDGAFYFLEMNTRLQVEHPVTEAVTGVDLVAWQFLVAAGAKLPLRQDEIRWSGHAIEARLYAEDPARDFLPQSGEVLMWRPPVGEGVRVDHGLSAPQSLSPFYDPMMAKIIAFGADREQARRRLQRALESAVLFGLPTNRDFLIDVLSRPDFIDGAATTRFIEAHFAQGFELTPPSPEILGLAAVLLRETRSQNHGALSGWNSTGAFFQPMKLGVHDEPFEVFIRPSAKNNFEIRRQDQVANIEIQEMENGALAYRLDGFRKRGFALLHGDGVYLQIGATTIWVENLALPPPVSNQAALGSMLHAPMNGRIVAVLAQAGDVVKKGQRIVVLEAMKMQHEICAPRDGVLAGVHVKEGDQVATRHVLARLEDEALSP